MTSSPTRLAAAALTLTKIVAAAAIVGVVVILGLMGVFALFT
jgi:hypothetical protein